MLKILDRTGTKKILKAGRPRLSGWLSVDPRFQTYNFDLLLTVLNDQIFIYSSYDIIYLFTY